MKNSESIIESRKDVHLLRIVNFVAIINVVVVVCDDERNFGSDYVDHGSVTKIVVSVSITKQIVKSYKKNY